MSGIVIHKFKMVYWWIPKVACTTLKTHFAALLGIPYEKHVHYAKFEFTEKPIEGYFNFAYVRNPKDRIVSLYMDKIVNNYSEFIFGQPERFSPSMDFSDFLYEIVYQGLIFVDDHVMPQLEQIPEGVTIIKMENDPLLRMLPKVNRTEKKIYVSPIDEEFIRKIYAQDYKLFNSCNEKKEDDICGYKG